MHCTYNSRKKKRKERVTKEKRSCFNLVASFHWVIFRTCLMKELSSENSGCWELQCNLKLLLIVCSMKSPLDRYNFKTLFHLFKLLWNDYHVLFEVSSYNAKTSGHFLNSPNKNLQIPSIKTAFGLRSVWVKRDGEDPLFSLWKFKIVLSL